ASLPLELERTTRIASALAGDFFDPHRNGVLHDERLFVVADRARAEDGAVAAIVGVRHSSLGDIELDVRGRAEILELRVKLRGPMEEVVNRLAAQARSREIQMCRVAAQFAKEAASRAAEAKLDGAVEPDQALERNPARVRPDDVPPDRIR